MPYCTSTTGVDCRGCLALNEEQEPEAQLLQARGSPGRALSLSKGRDQPWGNTVRMVTG